MSIEADIKSSFYQVSTLLLVSLQTTMSSPYIAKNRSLWSSASPNLALFFQILLSTKYSNYKNTLFSDLYDGNISTIPGSSKDSMSDEDI